MEEFVAAIAVEGIKTEAKCTKKPAGDGKVSSF